MPPLFFVAKPLPSKTKVIVINRFIAKNYMPLIWTGTLTCQFFNELGFEKCRQSVGKALAHSEGSDVTIDYPGIYDKTLVKAFKHLERRVG